MRIDAQKQYRAPGLRGLRQSFLCALSALTLSLYGCGGGGSGGAPTNGAGGASPSAPGTGQNSTPPASLTASVSAVNAAATTTEGGVSLGNPVTFTVPTSGTYYFQLSFEGTALTEVATNGVTSTDYSTGNSAIGSTPALGYDIGTTIHGSWSGTQFGINAVYFYNPQMLAAGIYHDAITLHVCQDAACATELAGSPVTIPVTYTVTGNAIPDGIITPYPNVEVEFPGSQSAPASASIIIDGSSLPPTGAYVTSGASGKGLITQTRFSAPLAANPATASAGTLSLTLAPPSTVGVGIHTDTLPINVCFDSGCQRPAAGSPWTANVTYIVDPVAGVDYTQSTIGISTAGIVWDAATSELYAIVAGSSALDPNTLAVIDPISASIVQTVQLDGGTGHIEPGTLAVSNDGQYLYVAVSDASGTTDHIERLRTSDLGLDQTITLPAEELVGTLAPAPSAPHTLAVETSGNSPQLVIYDDATPRSATLAGQGGDTLTSFTWGADSSTIYAAMRGTTGTLDEVSVTTSGLQVTKSISSQPLLSAATTGGPMQFAEGLICWNSGATFDPVAFAPGNSFNAQTSTFPSASFDGSLDRAYFITTDQAPGSGAATTNIEAFRLSSRDALWILRFPAQNPATQLTRWGTNGLAFADNAGGTQSLVLVSGPLITQ